MDFDMAGVLPSVWNWVLVGLLATTFIVFMKWFTARFPILGINSVFQAV